MGNNMSNEGIVMSERDIIDLAEKAGFKISGDDFGNPVIVAPYSGCDFQGILKTFADSIVEHCKQGKPNYEVYALRAKNAYLLAQLSTNSTPPQPPCDNDHVADGCELFAHAMPKSEGKPVACTYCETGTWQGNLCTECSGTGFTTPQPTTDISEPVAQLITDSEQKAILKNPYAIAPLIHQHEVWEVEGDAFGIGTSFHRNRIEELRKIAIEILKEDPECWTPEILSEFKVTA